MKYTVLVKTTFYKEITVEANSPEEAQAKTEEDINKGSIDGIDTFDFDTDIIVYK